jgi:hypothetical protein
MNALLTLTAGYFATPESSRANTSTNTAGCAMVQFSSGNRTQIMEARQSVSSPTTIFLYCLILLCSAILPRSSLVNSPYILCIIILVIMSADTAHCPLVCSVLMLQYVKDCHHTHSYISTTQTRTYTLTHFHTLYRRILLTPGRKYICQVLALSYPVIFYSFFTFPWVP